MGHGEVLGRVEVLTWTNIEKVFGESPRLETNSTVQKNIFHFFIFYSYSEHPPELPVVGVKLFDLKIQLDSCSTDMKLCTLRCLLTDGA